jgi:hypothetical protein
MNDGGDDDQDEPKRREFEQVLSEGQALRMSGLIREYQQESQEKSHCQPSAESVREFEIVMSFRPEGRVCNHNYGDENDE